jgi:hypothetical protein
MLNIKPIVKYPCPETGRLFDSAERASASAAQEIARRQKKEKSELREKARTARLEQLRNSIRLEAGSISEIEAMLNSRAKILYPNEKIPKVTIAGVRVSHFEIKNKVPVTFRDCAEVSFELNFHSKDGYEKVSKLIETSWSDQKGFHGFSSCGGGSGRKYVRINLKDWPKLWAKYRKKLSLESTQRNNVSKEREAEAKACKKASAGAEYIKLSQEVEALQLKQRELYRDLKKKYYKAPKLKDVADIEELKEAFAI